MSKGLGQTQRFVLELLARTPPVEPWRRWRTAHEIAQERAGRVPTTAELESVRRAIRRLAALGRVETMHPFETRAGEPRTVSYYPPGESVLVEHTYTPDSHRRVLTARLPLNDEERTAEAAHEQERAERIRAIFTRA